MKYFAFAASHRPDSLNRKLLKHVAAHMTQAGAELDIAEYNEFDMRIYDDNEYSLSGIPHGGQHFAARLSAADGMIIALPEYNWSFPGSLKNIIDWVSRATPAPFIGRTALLLCATPSARGGFSGLLQLRVPLEALGMAVHHRVFGLGSAHKSLDAEGNITIPEQQKLLHSTLSDFMSFTARLRG